MTSFSQIVAAFIEQEQLFAPTDHLLLAVSGGVDSMVLWHVLEELGHDFMVAHCNFQLRGLESEADEEFVREQADTRSIACHVKRFATKAEAARSGKSVQEIARTLRYDFFEDICNQKGCKYILTAHHIDDRIETFWLNFSRGAGLQGLSSLRPKRDNIRRPLLGVSRAQVVAYQRENNILYREDSSNAETKYKRNAFRQNVLPALFDWAPQLPEVAAKNFKLLEQMSLLLTERIEAYRQELLKKGEENTIVFLKSQIDTHAARLSIGFELLREFDVTIDQCRQVFTARSGSILQTSSHEVLVGAETATIRAKQDPVPDIAASIWLATEPSCFIFPDAKLYYELGTKPKKIPATAQQAWVDARELSWPLSIRYWQAGDRFSPLGMQGQMQKLQDFFTNQKISQFRRQQVPLLVNGDGRIIWVVGLRLDDRFKLQEDTDKVACFSLVN